MAYAESIKAGRVTQMTMELEGRGGCLSFTLSQWSDILVRANKHGWEPLGPEDLLHLTVEIKGYWREDAKEKKSTMETYWGLGMNNLKEYGRWAFAEFTEIYQIEADFKGKVESSFGDLISKVIKS